MSLVRYKWKTRPNARRASCSTCVSGASSSKHRYRHTATCLSPTPRRKAFRSSTHLQKARSSSVRKNLFLMSFRARKAYSRMPGGFPWEEKRAFFFAVWLTLKGNPSPQKNWKTGHHWAHGNLSGQKTARAPCRVDLEFFLLAPERRLELDLRTRPFSSLPGNGKGHGCGGQNQWDPILFGR